MTRSGSAESLLKQLADPDSTPQTSGSAPAKPKSEPDSLHEVLARAGSSHRREKAEPMAVSPAPREMKQERVTTKAVAQGDVKPERLPTKDLAPLKEKAEQPPVRDHAALDMKPAPQPAKTAESRKAEAEQPPNMNLPPPETQVERTHIRHDGPGNVKLEQRSSSDHTPRQALPERLPARDDDSVGAPPEQRLPSGPTQPNAMAERLSTNPGVFASRVSARAAATESAKPETNSAPLTPQAARQVPETGSIVSAPPELKKATATLQGSPKSRCSPM